MAIASPLVALPDRVAFVGEGGAAFTWDLTSGDGAVSARGTFRGSVEGAVAAFDASRLVAVVDGSVIATVDLRDGRYDAIAALPARSLTGAFAVDDGVVYAEQATASGTQVVSVDRERRLTALVPMLSRLGVSPFSDAGGGGALPPSHTALLVGAGGAVAFGTFDGHVGVTSAGAKAEIGTLPCGTAASARPSGDARPSAGFSAIVPAAAGAFVVACSLGTVALVQGE